MKLAFCGNPNVGKTTLYNRLTRSDEPVGNWHGVTVDVRTKRADKDVYISDLPGAYSLTPRTAEERITRDDVLFGDYDAIIYVAEVNNLRRNLYMFMQLAEAGKKAVLVVNMMDEARGKVDLELLSKRLSVAVIGTSDRYENPKRKILDAARAAKPPRKPDYLNEPIVRREAAKLSGDKKGLSPEFCAIKAIEHDKELIQGLNCGDCSACGVDRDLPAKLRYSYIDKILDGVTERPKPDKRTAAIDKAVLGWAALPIFFVVMAAVFAITFELGKPLSDLLVGLTELACVPVRGSEMPEVLKALLTDGVISGVGMALAFLPQVVLMFLLTALLQDSGYMSRVAYLTDGFFKKFGLSGRAAFSVVLGLGCSATAVLASRGISGEKRRRRAAFATPFCPCSARLAVFTAICAYFELPSLYVAAMYVAGFAAMLVVLKISCLIGRKTEEDDSELIMEVPPYRLPRVGRVMSVVIHNVISFITRIGSVVLGVSVIMWVLCNFSVADGFIPGGGERSIMSTFAGLISPVFAPLGFGNWRAVTALISGVAAKETVISVISSLGGFDAVFDGKTAAVSFMIFTCLYVPCVATLSALAKETGWKSAALSIAVHTAAAYIAALVYYGAATLFQNNKSAFWIVIGAVAAIIAVAISVQCIKAITAKRSEEKNRGKKTRIKS